MDGVVIYMYINKPDHWYSENGGTGNRKQNRLLFSLTAAKMKKMKSLEKSELGLCLHLIFDVFMSNYSVRMQTIPQGRGAFNSIISDDV